MRDEETVALNRRARHEFSIDETFEAGIVLTGTEIKSIRAGKANLSDAYARIEHGEAWLIGAHIAPYEGGNRYNHEPKRTRKLLLRRAEIDQLLGRAKAKGQTIVPLRLYINGRGRAKVELGLARGKRSYDKRQDLAKRDADREISRVMGRRGTNQITMLNLSVPAGSLGFWADRLGAADIQSEEVELFGTQRLHFAHQCGIEYSLVADDDGDPARSWEGGGVPAEHAVLGTHGVRCRCHQELPPTTDERQERRQPVGQAAA